MHRKLTMADSARARTRGRLAQAQLDASDARILRVIVEAATDGIVSVDAQGVIVQANRAVEQMFGYTGGELLGRPLTCLIPPRFHEAHLAGLARYLTTGETRVIGRTLELAGVRTDGVEFPVELSIAASRSPGGTIFIGIIRDVTWRQRVERELAEQRAQLEVANKELEAFSYSVSHDLRAPLRSIQGFSQVLLTDSADRLDAHGRETLQRICAATTRMEQLIDAMLTLARVTRSDLRHEALDLSAIAHAVAKELHGHEPARAVEFLIQPTLTAQGDQPLLRVVLENLLGNAWKATVSRPQGRIEFGATGEPGHATFFVRDNGIGFDQAYAHKLFVPLQTLHRRSEFQGSGIGLATVHRVLTRHGGTVWGVGEPGQGATFYFTL